MTASLTYPTAQDVPISSDTPITVQDRRRYSFFMVDNEIIDIYVSRIGAYGFAVYSALIRFSNKEGVCFPSLNTLTERLGFSKPAVIKAIDTLIEHGLIAKQHRFNDKGEHISNLYIILEVKQEPNQAVKGSKRDLPPPGKSELPPSQGGSKRGLPKQDTLINNTQQTEQNPQTPVAPLAISEAQKTVVVALTDLGISENVACFLASKYEEKRIIEKIAYLEFLQDIQPDSIKSSCGWLRTAIEKDFGKPDGFVPEQEQNASEDTGIDQEEQSVPTAQEIQEQRKLKRQRHRQELTEQYGTTEENLAFWEKAKLEIAYTTQPYIGDLVAQAEILSFAEDSVIIGVERKQDWRQLQHPPTQTAIRRALGFVAGRGVDFDVLEI